MTGFEQLTAADPARDRVPTHDEAERMDARMARLLAGEAAAPGCEAAQGAVPTGRGEAARGAVPTGRGAAARGAVRARGASRRRGTYPRPRWALVPLAAAALYAAFALGASDETPRSFPPAPATAAAALADLSRKAADAPAQTGRYAYEKRLSYVSHMRGSTGGKGRFVVVLPHEDEQWIADDGTGVVRNVIHEDQPTFPTPEDKAAYEASPGGPPFDSSPRRIEDATVAGMPAAEVRALPTDPARLRKQIEGGDVTLTAMVGQLLASALTPPDVKVALFAVLKQLPGATLRNDVTDPQGRKGVGVEFQTEAWRTLFLFDERTGALLATRSIGHKEVPGRDIDDWTLVIESGRRDDAPTARTLTKKVA
jgi:hypothetical protein